MPNDTVIASFKRQRNFLLILCGALFAISSFVIKPLYIVLFSDVLLQNTLVLGLLELLLELCDIFAYASVFSVIIYAVLFVKKQGVSKFIAIFVAVAFLRRIADLIMTIIIYGAIDGTDILSILFSVAMETVQVLAVYLISSCVLKNHEVPTAEYLPLKKIYSKGNPLQISAIFAGLVLSAVKVLSRIIYDVFYGLPESLIEVLSMILFYASDMLVSVIAYGAILIIVAGIHRSALVKKQD